MPDASASHLERGAYGLLLGATGWIYARGLQNQDEGMREIALTSAEGMAVGGLVTAAAKFAFGRARPNENRGPFAFGQHGRSFASGEATPAFALAAGISEYGSNHWYVALPAYGAAAAVGLARMGEDAHWLSDVVGSALIGVASTKLLLQLHRQRAGHGHRVQIIPLLSPTSVGVLVYREWGGAAPDAERTPARGRNSRAGFFGAARGEH
jgi:membrane-associated phospholipid phosphatase